MLYINTDSINIDYNTVVTIGNFDGFHIGHKKLCEKAVNLALERGFKSLLFTFCPHPLKVLKGTALKLLFTGDEKLELAKEMGFDIFLEYPFTLAFAETKGADFVRDTLFNKLKCKVLVVGEDFKLGKDKSFTASDLIEVCGRLGIEVIVLPILSKSEEKISSTFIRELISSGDMEKASEYLGRDYFVCGEVVKGRHVGHKLGFPTMNLFLPEEKLSSKKGVYITQTFLDTGESYPSITNLGNNVTFGYFSTRLETYALGLNKDLYGEKIRVSFKKLIRGEIKFNSPEDLSAQLNSDLQAMKDYFINMRGVIHDND